MNTNIALPVAADLDAIVEASRHGAVVVMAPPGSGKTTLVPAALLDDLTDNTQQVILVQPRRMAARAVARRIALLRNSPLGQEIGYQVRFDSARSPQTRLLVVTTGILLRILTDDCTLENVAVVVLDEFHERSVEMDTVLGFLIRLQETVRHDLRIVVMSATLDAGHVSDRLSHCPVVNSPGRTHPIDIHYESRRTSLKLHEQVTATLPRALRETEGHVLVFLPGVGEILRCRDELRGLADRENLNLFTLYGDLPPEEQDHVMMDNSRRKVVLATNVAETSITIEGVTGVVDTGQVRQMNVHPAVGLPRLEMVPICRDSADQRAGRAGRTGPGHCWRLWDKASHAARPARQAPEIRRSDLAPMVLQLLAWDERDMNAFPWLDPPPPDAIESARQLLRRLGAIDEAQRLTDTGWQLLRLPTHPRLGRLLLAGAAEGVLREAAVAAALLSERDPFRAARHQTRSPRDRTNARTRSDIADRVIALQAFHAGQTIASHDMELHVGAARQVLRAADQLFQAMRDVTRAARHTDPFTGLLRVLTIAFPDRLARLRSQSQDRGLMVGGRGVRLDHESHVRGEPLFLCLELNDGSGDARVRMASAVEPAWLPGTSISTVDELFFNPTRGQVEARRRIYCEDLMLEETPVAIDDAPKAAMLLAEYAGRDITRVLPAAGSPAMSFLARYRWLQSTLTELAPNELAWPRLDDARIIELLSELCRGRRSLDEVRKSDWLCHFQSAVGYERLADIDRLAPVSLPIPGGRRVALQYEPGKPPVLAARIQELFGLRETPRVAGGRVPVLLHLLGPNNRPQQVTDDLPSFWANTYPIVRKELRRRYPKHKWPEDPCADHS